jgi:hypothetical protein
VSGIRHSSVRDWRHVWHQPSDDGRETDCGRYSDAFPSTTADAQRRARARRGGALRSRCSSSVHRGSSPPGPSPNVRCQRRRLRRPSSTSTRSSRPDSRPRSDPAAPRGSRSALTVGNAHPLESDNRTMGCCHPPKMNLTARIEPMTARDPSTTSTVRNPQDHGRLVTRLPPALPGCPVHCDSAARSSYRFASGRGISAVRPAECPVSVPIHVDPWNNLLQLYAEVDVFELPLRVDAPVGVADPTVGEPIERRVTPEVRVDGSPTAPRPRGDLGAIRAPLQLLEVRPELLAEEVRLVNLGDLGPAATGGGSA